MQASKVVAGGRAPSGKKVVISLSLDLKRHIQDRARTKHRSATQYLRDLALLDLVAAGMMPPATGPLCGY